MSSILKITGTIGLSVVMLHVVTASMFANPPDENVEKKPAIYVYVSGIT